MSLQDLKFLLRKYQLVPNKLLGQNFMVDSSIFPKLNNHALLSSSDVVLEVGAGFGFLTRFLSKKCKFVVAVEKDPRIAEALGQQIKDISNAQIVKGDIFKVDIPAFNKVISIPPYYISSNLVLWLLDRDFDSAVLVFQKEFAKRLIAKESSEDYGWLKVVTSHKAEVDLLDSVPKWMFYPPPEVDSVVVRLKPWTIAPFTVNDESFFRRLVRWLFTQRNKKLHNAIVPLIRSERKIDKKAAEEIAFSLSSREKRVRDLSPKDFGALANVLCN